MSTCLVDLKDVSRTSATWMGRTSRGGTALLTLCLFCAVAQAADEGALTTKLSPGMRVRVLAPGYAPEPIVGTIYALDERSIRLQTQARAEPLTVPREQITRLDLSAGRRSRLPGALIGAAVGGAAGALAGSQSSSYRDASQAGGALVGVLVGALVGALIPPGERWNLLSSSGYRVTLGPAVLPPGERWNDRTASGYRAALAPDRAPIVGLTLSLAF